MDCTCPGGCRLLKAAKHESTNDDDRGLDGTVGQGSRNTVYDPKIGMDRADSLSSSYVHRSPISLPTVSDVVDIHSSLWSYFRTSVGPHVT